MLEHIIQMGPVLVLAGLLTGWVAEAASRAGGYGLLVDMAVALVGGLAVGGTLWAVISTDANGMLAMFLVGCGGAALAIVAQRWLWRSARVGT
jgi:uncharacterized membrane protein YeaQ/YmgE (transglycosylase-associated protein family)